MMILMNNSEKTDSEVSNTASLGTKGALIYHLHGMCALRGLERSPETERPSKMTIIIFYCSINKLNNEKAPLESKWGNYYTVIFVAHIPRGTVQI